MLLIHRYNWSCTCCDTYMPIICSKVIITSLVTINFTFLRLLGNYGIIYKVIMRKFRASLEPFWDSKFNEYVEYLARVSSECLTSSVLPSLTSSDGRTSRILLADVILWIYYIDSPALYIARTMNSVPLDQSEVRKLYCAVEFFSALKLFTIEVESHSQTPDDQSLVCDWGILYCEPTILTIFTTCTISTMQLPWTWSSFHNNTVAAAAYCVYQLLIFHLDGMPQDFLLRLYSNPPLKSLIELLSQAILGLPHWLMNN